MNQLISLIASGMLLFGTTFAEEWVSRTGKVGNETFNVSFPTAASTKNDTQDMTLFAKDGDKALYILAVSNAPIVKNPTEVVGKFVKHHNTSPKKLLKHTVSQKGENTFLDIEAMNTKSQIKTKIRYVITPKNIWELKTAYDNLSDQQHDTFVNSFSL